MAGSKIVDASSCPNGPTLAALLSLPADDSLTISLRNHLAHCAACQYRLDQLTDSPELAGVLERLIPDADGWSHRIDEVVARINSRINSAVSQQELSTTAHLARPSFLDTKDNTATTTPMGGIQTSEGRELEISPRAIAELPTKIGRYPILKTLGVGGMGVVYLAFDEQLQRKVAIKTIDIASRDKQLRLEREAIAIARLDSAEVVRLYSVERTETGETFLTMEFVDGLSLLDQLRNGPRVEIDHAVDICLQAARGVHAAHLAGILHRDIKPGNILLDRTGRAKIVDFSLAQFTQTDAALTRTGVVVGTPTYMSPEQVAGTPLDPRCDVYGLGCVLYEALTGIPPFQGTTFQILRQITQDEPIALRRLNEQIPLDLQTICQKAMSKQRDQRYHSADELAADLTRWKSGDAILARPTSAFEGLMRWTRKNRRVTALISTIAALLLVITLGSVFSVWLIARANRTIESEKNLALAAEVRSANMADEASRQRTLALETLNDLIFKVQEQLKDTPRSLETRQTILESALVGLNRVVDSPNDTRVDHSAIVAHQRIGDILMRLGDSESARLQYELARELARAAYQSNPKDRRAGRDLASSISSLAGLKQEAFEIVDSESLFQQALELQSTIIAMGDDDPLLRSEMAHTLIGLGDARSMIGGSGAADLYQRSFESMQQLTREFPEVLEYSRRLATAVDRLSNLAINEGDFNESERLTELRLDLATDMIRQQPQNSTLQREYARSLNQRGRALAIQDRLEEALEYVIKATEVFQEIATADPTNAIAESDVGHQWFCQALIRFQADEMDQAQAAWQKSLEIHERLWKAQPTNTRYALLAVEVRTMIGNAKMHQGDLASAVMDYDAAIELLKELPSEIGGQNKTVKLALAICLPVRDALNMAIQLSDVQPQSIELASDAEQLAIGYYALYQDLEMGQTLARKLLRVHTKDPIVRRHLTFSCAVVFARSCQAEFEKQAGSRNLDSEAVHNLGDSLRELIVLDPTVNRNGLLQDPNFRVLRSLPEFDILFSKK